jgi:hypothetical protein
LQSPGVPKREVRSKAGPSDLEGHVAIDQRIHSFANQRFAGSNAQVSRSASSRSTRRVGPGSQPEVLWKVGPEGKVGAHRMEMTDSEFRRSNRSRRSRKRSDRRSEQGDFADSGIGKSGVGEVKTP